MKGRKKTPHYVEWWKNESFLLKSEIRRRWPLSSLLFNMLLEVLAWVNRQVKEIKDINTEKLEVKLSLFINDIILYVENPKISTKILSKPINEVRKGSGHKINTWKSVSSLYTNKELSEKVIMKTILFSITSWRIKYLGLTKEVKGVPGGYDGKKSVSSVGDPGWIPGWGRFPGEGNGNPLQYSCLENPMDGGAWRATVHGDTKSQTWLSYWHTTRKEEMKDLYK